MLLLVASAAPPIAQTAEPATPTLPASRNVPVQVARAAVRAEARRVYGSTCGEVRLPNSAFIPIEISGGGTSEYAVLFDRGTCVRSRNQWQNTGGSLVQFWRVTDGSARLLREQYAYGFTPTRDGVQSLRHMNFCPNLNSGLCIVTYRWDKSDRKLEVANRRPLGPRSRMRWDFRAAQ